MSPRAWAALARKEREPFFSTSSFAASAWDVSQTDAGQKWGCRLESYLTDPAERPDASQWQTELAFRLAD
jgi:hypothetical protein